MVTIDWKHFCSLDKIAKGDYIMTSVVKILVRHKQYDFQTYEL